MTAPLAKVDALLAARVAPWLELLAPKAPAAAGQAQPVLNAPRVDNEVLLPTRAGVHPQPADAAATRGAPAGAGESAASSHTDLSAAARVIQAVLSDRRQGDAGPVRGTAPVWHGTRQAPAADALSTALSQRLSESGLFYESHLGQFAAGTRSLAQMQREPQAALLFRAESAADDGATAGQLRQPGQQLPLATPQATPLAMPAASAAAPLVAGMASTLQAAPDAPASHDMAAAPHQEPADAAQQPQSAPRMDLASSPTAHLARHAAEVTPAADRLPMPAAVGDAPQAPAPMAIHPQAGALVHQQLDLLASGMFRWTGEAWPGVPMQWTLVQEEGARHAAEPADTQQGSWSTTVSLDLPRLGRIDLRLSLSGSSARAQLAAPRPDALMQLRAHRATLSQRMAAAGFELRSLQMDPELAAS